MTEESAEGPSMLWRPKFDQRVSEGLGCKSKYCRDGGGRARRGEALERSAVGETALCDVMVRRGLCGREAERAWSLRRPLTEGGGEQCGVGLSGWRIQAPDQ